MLIGSVAMNSVLRAAPGATTAEPWITSGLIDGGLVLGVFAAGDTAYVCADGAFGSNVAFLLTFDLATAAETGRYEFPGGGFCNDVAVAADGTAYVAATRARELLIISRFVGTNSAPAWGVLNDFLADALELPVPATASYLWHPSVERMVASALDHLEASHLVGVMMTGMGNDGAEAMKRLRLTGGHTIAEAESSAIVWGMPGELVKNGGAETVRPLEDIAETIIEMVNSCAAD